MGNTIECGVRVEPVAFTSLRMWYRVNISSRFSRNSEADASEFLEYLGKNCLLVTANSQCIVTS